MKRISVLQWQRKRGKRGEAQASPDWYVKKRNAPSLQRADCKGGVFDYKGCSTDGDESVPGTVIVDKMGKRDWTAVVNDWNVDASTDEFINKGFVVMAAHACPAFVAYFMIEGINQGLDWCRCKAFCELSVNWIFYHNRIFLKWIIISRIVPWPPWHPNARLVSEPMAPALDAGAKLQHFPWNPA